MTDRELMEVLHDELRAIRQLLEQQARTAPRSVAGDILSLAEAAAYIGVAPMTLRAGKAGTSSIARYSNRPVQFLRASLDGFKRGRIEQAQGGKRAKRISLVRRTPRKRAV